ncbi:triacylglycerol lipase [Nocardia mangyaensis]|uniref:Triacylglycerol lipase n=1 Tax=Nocardia mangyaensis TaxID=2213200 RepID=A0A1J0VWC7_9NOCA|nr:lipase family protein [Nocardia mangyaensis]APE36334.1 triacylglycerol lipase [Nocardia mangyaensis]
MQRSTATHPSPRSRWRRVRTLPLVAVAALVTAGPAAAQDFQLPPLPNEAQVYPALVPVPTPQNDPWYDDPADFAAFANGDVIRSRVVQTYSLGIPIPVHTTQLLLRSTDAHDAPQATATTVLMPGIPWLGPGARPLISYQEAIDSLGQQCNPSYTLRAGLQKEIALIGQFLAAGAAVVVTDFDGKNNTIMSPSEGRMVLDGIRAAQRGGLGLENSPIGLWGYSGGGNSSASAAEQRQHYAPELDIRGSAQGGIPGDKVAIAPFAISGQQPQANFTGWLAILGLAREFPEFDRALQQYLTPEGKQVAEDLRDRCLYTAVGTTFLRPVIDYLTDPDAALAAAHAGLAQASFGKPENTPDMPLLMWHSTTDQLLPAELAITDIAAAYCARGVDMRMFWVPMSEHISAEIVPELGTVAWLLAVTAGADPGPRVC